MPTTYETSQGEERRTPPPSEHLQDLQDDAQALLNTAREQGSAKLDEYRGTAADQLESLAQTAQSAAEQMQDKDTLGLSNYVTDAAQSLTTLADNLRSKSAEELLQQTGQLARDNPALFLAGSIALGFGLSRFLRASKPDINASASRTRDNDFQQGGAWGRNEPGHAAGPQGTDDGFTASSADGHHSSQPGTANPAQSQSSATAGTTEPGIKPSGAELGSFESSAHPAASASDEHSHSVIPIQPTPKREGEL
ncbi:hypothetical protein [Pseudomonas sp. LP_7_YM]|uniref:hypothetical protein n=1 Tax=Pseudomonas sp. LP_7_YM TaxID=2485137 RepID=UPI0010ECDD14|nr:hypothetical protein [Pseudomonas sp. LP_7_YM]TDV59427.1 hypothetical protein EC915_11735 [Pseudomonas sp. LP_7_YM]